LIYKYITHGLISCVLCVCGVDLVAVARLPRGHTSDQEWWIFRFGHVDIFLLEQDLFDDNTHRFCLV